MLASAHCIVTYSMPNNRVGINGFDLMKMNFAENVRLGTNEITWGEGVFC